MYIGFKMNNIFNLISKHISIFDSFTEVYFFGSVIKNNNELNDLDVLLVYEKYSEEIFEAKNMIESFLKNLLVLDIDLTILSSDELFETKFLEKICIYERMK